MATRPFPTAKWKGKLHYHGCQCGRTYGDACTTPEKNGRCNPCISGIPSKLARGREPTVCCLTNLRPAEKYDRERYNLAGPGPWWICKTCARQFIRPPKEVPTHDD